MAHQIEYPLRRHSVAATAAARRRSFADKCTQAAHSSASRPLAFRRSTAALARGLAALAQSGPALHGSGQPIRSPGSQLLADRRLAGRASFRTARTQFVKPRPSTALAPPSGSHPECALGRARWILLVRRAARLQEITRERAIPLMRREVSLTLCLICARRNCDTLP
jgi:hypothetical protein